jgi:hypothetical protein
VIDLYGVIMIKPDGTELLYRVFTNKSDCVNYLKVCQTATGTEHWRMAEFGLDRNVIPS